MRYGRMDSDDLSGGLMTEDVFVLHDHRPNAPSMPKVHV
jgi:hypothetical protein